MAKKKRETISITKFETLVDKEIIPVTVGDVEFVVTKTLSLDDMLAAVANIVYSCFDPDTGDYLPEVFDFKTREVIATMYANFKLPENIDRQYELLYNTPIVETVASYVNQAQLDEIIDIAKTKINYHLEKANNELVKESRELLAAIDGLMSKLTKAFENLSADDISNTLKTLADKNFTEESLARAVLSLQETQKAVE